MTNLALIVSLMLGTQQLQCGGSDIGKTVRDSLFNEVVRQDRAADAAWLACDTKEKLAEHQAWVRAGVLSVIGGLPEKTPLNARGAAAIPAAHAYFLERGLFASFATKNAPPSWHAVVNKPELHFSFADTVYGALKVYDWTDLQK